MGKSYELLGAPNTGSTLIEAALELTGLPYRITHAAPWGGEEDQALLRRLNPLGQIPVLILPDGTVMTESAAMMLHLGDRAPEAGLVPPPDAPERPVFLRWLVFLVASVYPTFSFDDTYRWITGERKQSELFENVDAHRNYMWTAVEEACGAPWFLGERFSCIDVYVAVMHHWFPGGDWFRRNCPKLTAIHDRLWDDPRLARMWGRNF